jgi:hypothetical protein
MDKAREQVAMLEIWVAMQSLLGNRDTCGQGREMGRRKKRRVAKRDGLIRKRRKIKVAQFLQSRPLTRLKLGM